jgi:putative ABC transport system permease protein
MISSRQRMKELSVLRAIGRSRAGIFYQVTAESLLLSCTGGLVGTVFGIGTIALLNRLLSSTVDGLPEYFVVFRVHPLAIVAAATLAASIGVLSSLLPAVSSAFRTPVSALRGEK